MKSLKLLVVTSSVAMLMAVSACSTPPPPTPSFSESEVIAIARQSKSSYQYPDNWLDIRRCWEPPKGTNVNVITNFASASFKNNGIWVVTVESSWGKGEYTWDEACIFLVDDATGKVVEN